MSYLLKILVQHSNLKDGPEKSVDGNNFYTLIYLPIPSLLICNCLFQYAFMLRAGDMQFPIQPTPHSPSEPTSTTPVQKQISLPRQSKLASPAKAW
jgi:hypothetical protein